MKMYLDTQVSDTFLLFCVDTVFVEALAKDSACAGLAEETRLVGTAAVSEMGEGDEQQPIAVITDASFVSFQDRNPTNEELHALKIALDDDVYASLLTSVSWKKGGE